MGDGGHAHWTGSGMNNEIQTGGDLVNRATPLVLTVGVSSAPLRMPGWEQQAELVSSVGKSAGHAGRVACSCQQVHRLQGLLGEGEAACIGQNRRNATEQSS